MILFYRLALDDVDVYWGGAQSATRRCGAVPRRFNRCHAARAPCDQLAVAARLILGMCMFVRKIEVCEQ